MSHFTSTCLPENKMANITDQDWMPEGLLITLHAIWPSVSPEGFDFQADPAGPQLLDDLRCFDCEDQNSLLFGPAPSSPSDAYSISTCSSLTSSEAPELTFELRSPAESDSQSFAIQLRGHTDSCRVFSTGFCTGRHSL